VSVSFIWGALMSTVLHETFPQQRQINNLGLAIFGLIILLLGVAGVAIAGSQLPIRLGMKIFKKVRNKFVSFTHTPNSNWKFESLETGRR